MYAYSFIYAQYYYFKRTFDVYLNTRKNFKNIFFSLGKSDEIPLKNIISQSKLRQCRIKKNALLTPKVKS